MTNSTQQKLNSKMRHASSFLKEKKHIEFGSHIAVAIDVQLSPLGCLRCIVAHKLLDLMTTQQNQMGNQND
jgi:hypothetical protein